jgi:UPF0755 protein
MKPSNKKALFVGSVIAVFILAIFLSSPGNPEQTTFTIESGEDIASIVQRLDDDGFIRSKTLFRWSLSKSGLATKIQPGTHDLADIKTFNELITRITSGGLAAEEMTLLVREGENLRHVQSALKDGGADAADDLFTATGNPAVYPQEPSSIMKELAEEYPFLVAKPANVSLEGYLFPDTYRVYLDAEPEDIARRMLDNFGDKMTVELLESVKASGRTFHEIITMASIIEREVRGETDRRVVSDIFWKRLDIGMRLQADSTVNYATGKSLPAVTYDDTRFDSPYNTYKYAGLPPGPIGNPGLEAIEAAANPTPNDYWYFLTDAEGNVHYASTLDGHNINKARYLK